MRRALSWGRLTPSCARMSVRITGARSAGGGERGRAVTTTTRRDRSAPSSASCGTLVAWRHSWPPRGSFPAPPARSTRAARAHRGARKLEPQRAREHGTPRNAQKAARRACLTRSFSMSFGSDDRRPARRADAVRRARVCVRQRQQLAIRTRWRTRKRRALTIRTASDPGNTALTTRPWQHGPDSTALTARPWPHGPGHTALATRP